MNELLPCPFCGGPVDVEKTHIGPMGMQFWGVKCRNTLNVGGTCAIEQIPSGSRETAIARWNSRATPVATVPVELVGAGPTPDYTGEGSAWVPPVESGDIDLGEGAWISISKYKLCGHGNRKVLWISAEEAKMKMPECVEARAVVVPAWRRSDFDKIPPEWSEMQCFGAGYDLATSRARATPADRVLGEGMAQIGAELLAAYEELWDMARIRCRATTEKEYGEQWRKINAIRANQGGAAT